MHSHLKKPACAIPSTIIIIPIINMIVSQFIPHEASEEAPLLYQKSSLNMLCTLSVLIIAGALLMHIPKTKIMVHSALTNVTTYLFHFSEIININIAIKITVANICSIFILSFVTKNR